MKQFKFFCIFWLRNFCETVCINKFVVNIEEENEYLVLGIFSYGKML